MSKDIYSFDIFDTLLYRCCFQPETVFRLVQQQIPVDYPEELRSNFSEIRSYVATYLNRINSRDVAFDVIYSFIKQTFLLTEHQKRTLMLLEIDVERRLLRPILSNIERAEHLIHSGHKVVLISDMYHTVDTLRSFIAPYSLLIAENCEIYVSAEQEGLTKWQKGLYELILKKYKISPQQLHHIGDNWYADVEVPRSLGIHAERYYPPFKENETLSKLLTLSEHKPSVEVSSRIAQMLVNKTLNSPQFNLGCCVAGPLLFSFVYWVLQEAKRKDLTTLFFLSRDGWILREIALLLAPALNIDVQIEYLQVSRLAVMTANYKDLKKSDIWKFVFTNIPDLTFAEFATRLLLNVEELTRLAETNGRSFRPNDKIDFDSAFWLKELILKSYLTEKIIARSLQCRENLKKYLSSKNFLLKKTAIVDVGWKGTIQDCLYEILEVSHESEQLIGLYFGVCEYTRLNCLNNKKLGYVFKPYSSTKFSWNNLIFIELFTHAIQKSVKTYSDEGKPVFADEPFLNEKFGIEVQNGVISYTKKVIEENLVKESFLTGTDCQAYLQLFSEPTRDLAEVLGDYAHSVGTTDSIYHILAPREGLIGLYKRWRTHSRPLWLEGYKMRLSSSAKFVLRCRSILTRFK